MTIKTYDTHQIRAGGGIVGQQLRPTIRTVRLRYIQGLSVSNDESWMRSVANIRLRRYLVCGASKWR